MKNPKYFVIDYSRNALLAARACDDYKLGTGKLSQSIDGGKLLIINFEPLRNDQRVGIWYISLEEAGILEIMES